MPCQLRYIINIYNDVHSRDIVVNIVIDTCYTCYNRLATFLMYNMIYVTLNHTNWVQITWQTEIKKYIYTYIKVLSQNCLAITLTSRASCIFFYENSFKSSVCYKCTQCDDVFDTAITCAAAISCFCQL